MEPAYMQQFE